MTLAHRVLLLLGPIAPAGKAARRRVLRSGYPALRALSRRLQPPEAAALAFPVVERPRVSVIIPVDHQYSKLGEILNSIGPSPGGPAFEVIAVVDGSSDHMFRALTHVPGLITVRNKWKLGRPASWNRGAQDARGEYLVFLDPGALVMPEALAALAQTFEEMPETGLAGAKVLHADGRLLEAGGALWRDGNATPYGQFDDADHPQYNFAREVDYCSGACLMVPRALFFELGGFDTEGTFEHYGEMDLAFKIHHSGHKVIYQPRAQVIQHDRERKTRAHRV